MGPPAQPDDTRVVLRRCVANVIDAFAIALALIVVISVTCDVQTPSNCDDVPKGHAATGASATSSRAPTSCRGDRPASRSGTRRVLGAPPSRLTGHQPPNPLARADQGPTMAG
jgi:hypothetical protein